MESLIFCDLSWFQLNISFVKSGHTYNPAVLTTLMSEFTEWLCAHFRAISPLRDHAHCAIMIKLCKAAMKGCVIYLTIEMDDTLFLTWLLGGDYCGSN